MSGIVSEDYGVGRSSDGISSGQRCQSGEALAEWRSSEQVENGTPSTSPPYWDTDDDDDDCGPKPSELFGKFTWKIENFSQISKRELRSNAFEVGGYKWYILIYPQGCDVCNHLSLFLCVANHDKLLPGWSHFAQFTIAVVNKDPKKSKYSDTLHRFWKKEHDWGWKKFMELSKVLDGFIVSDTLVIKAQVQVIREKSHRPFRCLDCQYRRELVRVYLTNVEQICRRFVEERRGKLGKFIEDKMRWSSFCAFWLGVDQNARRRMSREKTDVILKVVVKHFFIEKEVTSTLVMDSLYSGLKALECQSKSKKGRAKLLDIEETPAPIVCVESDTFVLVDDVLLLLERASVEPLPPKDEKGPQNRTKDGSSGEDFNKDSIERDERRLTELGRRTVEIFVLAHIFSNRIEVAYKEAVALKKQEELIREEEAAGLAESEQKAKRGTAEKERRTKKKQNKHKRSNRKGKDKGKDEKSDVAIQDKQDSGVKNSGIALKNLAVVLPEKPETLADGSDVSCIGDDSTEMPQPDLEDQEASPVNWDTDTSEVLPATEASSSGVSELPVRNGRADKKSVFMDDSSSTCSTDSVPSVVINGPYKGNTVPNYRSQTSPGRGKNRSSKERGEWAGSVLDIDGQPSELDGRRLHDASGACRAAGPESDAIALTLTDQMQWPEHHLVEKVSDQRTAVEASSSPNSPPRNLAKNVPLKPVSESALQPEPCTAKEMSSSISRQIEKAVPLRLPSPQIPAMSKPDVPNTSTPLKPTVSLHGETPTVHNKISAVSRPSSAPLIPGPRPNAPVVSVAQTAPMLARSVSAAGRLGTDPLPATHSCASQSYRNAIMGITSSSQVAISPPLSSAVALSVPHPQRSSELVSSSSIHPPPSPGMKDNSLASGRSGFTFGSVTPEILQPQPEWVGCSRAQLDTSNVLSHSSLANGIRNIDLYGFSGSGARKCFGDEVPAAAGLATRQTQGGGVSADEFPHLDIINYLLDEEHSMGKAGSSVLGPNNGHHYHPLGRQFTFHDDMSVSADLGFDRMEGVYHNEGALHHQLYHQTSSRHFDGGLTRDSMPVAGLSAGYANGQMDGMMQNHQQWQGVSADMSLLRMRNTEGDGYMFHHQMPEYSANLACGVNGYTIYRPSN